ncbi:hypothetical protein F2P56_014634 [Juglans regia]|uniref:Uncharacterized protein LOC108992629 n=2 Tax=Juglans regia TaxID=51240 RepID=A0A2I4ETP3_JUGRE|nr:uncharacterized protein LOC108992629 [Juglans regia]KAF5464563.1 hypothetical protein F2P56_014634 [Juglans regia]
MEKKPGTNMIKANWDAAMDLENKRMGMRIVFRDEKGEVLASVCDVKQNVHDPTLAESLALWRALEISFELSFSFSELMFEGDAVDIIQRINKVGEDQSWMGYIINDIKQVLHQKEGWSVCYVPREGNYVAHLLAKHALLCGEERVWIEGGPSVICNALVKDKICNPNFVEDL